VEEKENDLKLPKNASHKKKVNLKEDQKFDNREKKIRKQKKTKNEY